MSERNPTSGQEASVAPRAEAVTAGRPLKLAACADSMSFSSQDPAPCPPHVCPRRAFSYRELIERSSHYERLRRIIEPSDKELEDAGQWDTSGESDSTVAPGLQHKYPQTALILMTNRCFEYCRFCFRKRLFVADSNETASDYPAIARYIQDHPEINNVLLSGGDSLVLGTDQLEDVVRCLLPIRRLKAIRFGSRALVYAPDRFRDKALLRMFDAIVRAGKTPLLVCYFNHLDELSAEAEIHIAYLRRMGVQLLNQAVLLKDVNDDPDMLAATSAKLQELGVQFYYLFQARPAKGALHFQVPLRRGLEIVQAVNRRLSGIQKTHRYVMSHRTGKIEILDLDEAGRLYLRYHQCRDAEKIGRVFTRQYLEGACWLDDLR